MASLKSEVAVKLTDLLPVSSLKPNPWNTNVVSPENEARIDESIKRLGFFRPITVRQLEDGQLEILGGQHRWESAQRLGMTHVPVFNMGTITDPKAKEIGLADNGRYGQDDTLQLAELLKDLGTPEDLSTFLPYSVLDFQNIFAASSIALDTLEMPNESGAEPELPPARPAPTHQVMRFKVPVEDVAWISALIERTMKEKNFTAEDSLTNAGHAMVELLKVSK